MNSSTEIKIQEKLFALRDEQYRDFQVRLLPTVDPDRVIGVRTPELRTLAKEIIRSSDAVSFIKILPHQYFDEDQLHAFILSEMKDYDECVKEVCRFLPYVNNWATCDQMSPRVFSFLQKYMNGWARIKLFRLTVFIPFVSRSAC